MGKDRPGLKTRKERQTKGRPVREVEPPARVINVRITACTLRGFEAVRYSAFEISY